MIQNVSNAAILNAANSKPAANAAFPAPAASNAAKPETTVTAKAVPTVASINAQAFLERQQIGAALYDRSFTLSEGISALTTQKGIAAYAKKAESDGILTAAELQKLDKKLDKAEVKIQNMTTNNKGADLDSNAAIDGRDLDVVQQNLMDRINAGVKDGTLTKEEAEGLLKRQDELNELEAKLRESDGKLTAGEQKQVLDQLRKEADRVNSLRHNNVGVNLTYKTYADSIDARQAALEKQLEAGIKAGTLLEDEAKVIRGYLDDANNLEAEYGADGRIDWKDHNRLSTALNSAEIQLYDLQRNDFGKKLKASYVDVVHADKRQAQQLESIARGISNKSLTDEEAIATLQAQKGIQGMENDFIKGDDGKLDRGEYLRLQSAMNTFDLANHEAQTNSARWNGILKASAAAVTPAAPVPAASAPVPPVAAEKPAPAPVAAEKPAPAPVPPVASVPAPSPAPTPVTGEAKVEWHAGNALTMQAYDAKADKWIDVASKGRGESAAFNTTVKLSQDMLDGGRFRIVDGGTILENGRKSTNADGSVTIRFNDTGADQDFNDALITFKPSASNAPAPAPVAAEKPVVAPAPAAASAPAAEVKPEVKAEATQEAPSVSEQVRLETKSETQPTTAQINRELAREGNHFGDMMVKAMEAQSENLRKVHDELSHEAEKSHSDRESNDNHVKREAKSNVWVPENKGLELHGNAETERQVAAYAAAAASTAKYEPPIAKKVA